MTRINLLPWRDRHRQRQKRHYLIALAVVAASAVTLVLAVHLLVSAMVEAQLARNGYLQGEIDRVEARIRQMTLIEQKREALRQRMGVIVLLQQERSLPVHLLNELHQVVVPGVQLTRLELVAGRLSLAGYCESNNQLAELLRRVETSPWLARPRVKRILASDRGVLRRHSFELTLALITEQEGAE